jgi:hypothetical protein
MIDGLDMLEGDSQQVATGPVGIDLRDGAKLLQGKALRLLVRTDQTACVQIYGLAEIQDGQKQRILCHGAEIPRDGHGTGDFGSQEALNLMKAHIGEVEDEIPCVDGTSFAGRGLLSPPRAGLSVQGYASHGDVSRGGGNRLLPRLGKQDDIRVGPQACAEEVTAGKGQSVGQSTGGREALAEGRLIAYAVECSVLGHHIRPNQSDRLAFGGELSRCDAGRGVETATVQGVQQPQFAYGRVTQGRIPKMFLQTMKGFGIQTESQVGIDGGQEPIGGACAEMANHGGVPQDGDGGFGRGGHDGRLLIK